jgi:hyperosmotically inducible periplasmic protein
MTFLAKRLLPLFCGLLLAFSVTACDRQGPAERAGERIDEGAERAGERIEEGTERTGERLEETGEKAGESTRR